MKLSIVLPVFNESSTIEAVLRRVKEVDIEKEVVVVDDFSSDGTRQVLSTLLNYYDKLLLHDHNMGKGAANNTATPPGTSNTRGNGGRKR